MLKYLITLFRKNFALSIILTIVSLLLVFYDTRNIDIGNLQLHSIDDYVFHSSIRHMVESLMAGNLSGIFGFGFYQYGFLYFALNALVAAPGILTDNYSWAIVVPRLVTSIFALGSLVYIYTFSQNYLSKITSVLITVFFVSMPAFWYNATWFHPDWPMTFFILGFVYYLSKDNWEFGKNFKYSVLMYSLAVAFKYQAITAMPILALYIFYDFFRNPVQTHITKPLRTFLFSLLSITTIFIVTNPYIIHPMGWTAFSTSFLSNMESNATNHGSSGTVHLVTKINEAVGDYYINAIFLFLIILGSLWLLRQYFIAREKNIFPIIAINFIINLFYLLLFVNKAWQTYYLPVLVVGLLGTLYFIKKLPSKKQILMVCLTCCIQLIIYGSSYVDILTQSRDHKSPDYTTLSLEENQALNSFVINNLQGKVDSTSNILLTPYTPFSFTRLGLDYNQVKLIFGPLPRSSIDRKFYLEGQKKYWGELKSDEELSASFEQPDIIILRKDIPFMKQINFSNFVEQEAYKDATILVAELYDGSINYTRVAENDLVVIFSLKP